jgi:DNA-binding LacI/PurR family transcriptional regulator
MSISAVAERAGVSRTTVSLVINNRPSIPPATALAVRKAMNELGYTPAAPESRPGRKTKPIKAQAVRLALVTNMPSAWLRSPVYADVLHGIEIGAREAKATILLHHVPENETLDPTPLLGNIDGLILFGGQPTRQLLGPLGTLPCVQLMRAPNAVGWCDHVTYKSESIGYLAASYLLDAGHTHTACLMQDQGRSWAPRQSAFTTTIQQAGGTVLALDGSGTIQITGNEQTTDRELLRALLIQLFQTTPRPTGLFLSSDILAAPVYWLLSEIGLQPGRDMQVVSCNNERPLLNGLHPQPAVIDTQSEEVGRRAVECMLWRMKRLTAPIADILVQPVLVAPNP